MKNKFEDWVNWLNWNWCISRDRFYWVPIPIWHCNDCNEILLPEKTELPIDTTETSPNNKKCHNCSWSNFRWEKQVLDTWMTSSISTKIASNLIKKEISEFSLRPQAFEIIRTWLFYSVVKSYYNNWSKPFKDIMISGHWLDKKWIKISKRLGNYRNPNDIIDEYSADALRYWACWANLWENIRYNEDEIRKWSRTITKLWNASKFCFLFLNKSNPTKLSTWWLEDIDKWILDKLMVTIKESTDYFEKYQYSRVKKIIDTFFWNDFCDYYLELVKYRLYQEENSLWVKQTLFYILENTLKLYAPILPFITEEIWSFYFKKFSDKNSIHINEYPEINDTFIWNNNDSIKFENVISEIWKIRKFKTELWISIWKEIESYKLKNNIEEDYYDFIKKACRVSNIKTEF